MFSKMIIMLASCITRMSKPTAMFYLCMLSLLDNIQGVQEKLFFFTIYRNPSLAYIAVRDLQSSQRNASIQSLQLA